MLSGCRISELMVDGPVTSGPLLQIGTELVTVVAAAHARGAAFGALGPATVFVSPAGSIRVLDAAEEPISARQEDDLRAVGVLLYAMATGLTPHQAAGADGSVPSPIEWNPRLPSGLVRVIQRSVHPEASERFLSAVEILDALREVQRAPGSLDSLLPAEHVSSSAAVKPPPRPPADERGDEEPEPLDGDEPLGRLPFSED